MQTPMPLSGHIRAVLTLGLPLVGGHLAQFAIGLTDTVMLGWYGVTELAAVTLGASFFFVLFMLGSGFAIAVMPLVAASAGSGDERGIRRATRMGLWLSLGFALLSMPLMIWSVPILQLLGQSEELAEMAGAYLRIAGWGLIPALLVMTLKSYLAALERTQIVFWMTLVGALVNAAANYLLIFGNFGLPELGLRGAAVASVVTQLVTLVGVVFYARAALPEHSLFQRLWVADFEMLSRVFRLGTPIGLTGLSEVSLFATSALMMGWLGTVPLAAHGIAIQLASATFMVHLGLSNAATIRAGNAFGRGDRQHMARGAIVVSAASLVIAIFASILFLAAPEPLLSLFLDPDAPARPEIIALGVGLLAMAALFQLVDGMQVIALGLLRGVQDTTVPMIMAAISYWAVGLSTSYVLGFSVGLGGIGVWLGLVLGLSAAALLLMLRFWRHALPQVPLIR